MRFVCLISVATFFCTWVTWQHVAQRRLELGLDHLLTLEASQVRLVPGEDSDMETELDLDNVTLPLWTLKK